MKKAKRKVVKKAKRPVAVLPRDLLWTTKDGQEIPIRYLTTSHLLNIVHFLERNDELRSLLAGQGDQFEGFEVFEEEPISYDRLRAALDDEVKLRGVVRKH